MVDRQLRRRGIQDENVLRAMEEVPRECFLSPERRDEAYRDGAVAIGEGQTMSQPWIVACMTMLAEPAPHKHVLEVGTGSGYGAAVLSRCCRDVVTIAGLPIQIRTNPYRTGTRFRTDWRRLGRPSWSWDKDLFVPTVGWLVNRQ